MWDTDPRASGEELGVEGGKTVIRIDLMGRKVHISDVHFLQVNRDGEGRKI